MRKRVTFDKNLKEIGALKVNYSAQRLRVFFRGNGPTCLHK